MRETLIICILITFVLVGCKGKPLAPKEKSEVSSVPKVVTEKEKSERSEPLPPEVKIKLKKDGKDTYSWELSGSDVDQILKVNEKLRKQLGEEKAR